MAERKIQELEEDLFFYGGKRLLQNVLVDQVNTKEVESDPFHLNRLENDVRILSREAEAELVWKGPVKELHF